MVVGFSQASPSQIGCDSQGAVRLKGRYKILPLKKDLAWVQSASTMMAMKSSRARARSRGWSADNMLLILAQGTSGPTSRDKGQQIDQKGSLLDSNERGMSAKDCLEVVLALQIDGRG